jgi:sugar transferase (PEP-CTERM system associated)
MALFSAAGRLVMSGTTNHHISRRVSVLFFVEVVILMASVFLSARLQFPNGNLPLLAQIRDYFVPACAFALALAFSMSALGMYQVNVKGRFRDILLRLMPSFGLGFCIITIVFYFLPNPQFSPGVLASGFMFSALGILLTRIIYLKSMGYRFLESRIIFLGSGVLAKSCSQLATSNTTTHRYDLVGFIAVPSEDSCVPSSAILPPGESLLATAKKNNATEIVVSVQNRRGGGFPIQELLECKSNGIKVTDSTAFFEREACQIRVDSLQPSWLVFGNGFDQSLLRTFVKRTFDLVVSIILSIVTLPLMLMTSLLIYVEDRGPVFYQQERVGKGGRLYKVLKFRSMGNNAEEAGRPQWAAQNDPRTTRVGAIIRKLRIDELPQILNVLKGEMSFVGPRPERPYFVKQLSDTIPFYDIRHSIKPGITGMAQVRYQYGASVEDAVQKLQYDLYYVKNNSLLLDLLILVDTVRVVLLGEGAR